MARELVSGENEETQGLCSKSLSNKGPFIPLGLQYYPSSWRRRECSGIPATSLFARSEAVPDPEGVLTTEVTLGSQLCPTHSKHSWAGSKPMWTSGRRGAWPDSLSKSPFKDALVQGSPRPGKLSAVNAQGGGVHLPHSPRQTDKHTEKPERPQGRGQLPSRPGPLQLPWPRTHMGFIRCSVLWEGPWRG